MTHPAQEELQKYGLNISLSENDWVGTNWHVQGKRTWVAGVFTYGDPKKIDWPAWARRIAEQVGFDNQGVKG